MAEDQFKATPSLIVGLGGTGLKVATLVKKSLLEANQNQLPQRMALLVFDTETEIKWQAGGWGKERGQHRATGPVKIEGGEYVPLSGSVRALGEVIKQEQIELAANPRVRAGQTHRHISPWFQAQYYVDEKGIDDAVWNLDVGAGRLRQFGRMALFSKITLAKDMLEGALRGIKQMGADRLYVHVAGSLVGGTGASLFLDVAHLVKQIARSAGFTQAPVLLGHFVLTAAFRGTQQVNLADDGVKADFDARCYAALRELTRLQGTVVARSGGYPLVYKPDGTGPMHAQLPDSAYAAVYLYDGIREANPLNGFRIEEGLAPSIADAIVAYVDDRSSGAFCSHSVNYKAFYPAYNLPVGQVTYGSVGTYTIELPMYHIVEGWTHALARRVLDLLLQPVERDAVSQVPTLLERGQPGGRPLDPQTAAQAWLKESNTPLVARLAEWGLQAESTEARLQQAANDVLTMDAHGWQLKLAPSDPNWQNYVAEAQNELDGSLVDRHSLKYFVNVNAAGDTEDKRAFNLQNEVEIKLKQMLGESREVWLREGGDFRRALVRLGGHHVISFEEALAKWLTLTLNGDPHIGTVSERKQARLGHARAFLERVDLVLKAASRVLRTADEQSRTRRRAQFDTLDAQRKGFAADMSKSGGLLGRKRERTNYLKVSDDLAQFHKADIARQVVADLIGRLQKAVTQALEEVMLWERILATARAAEGGTYALVVAGNHEIDTDRKATQSAVRWVIADDEVGDTYLSGKREQYERNKVDEIIGSIEWRVGRAEGSGDLRIDFILAGKAWDRRAGAATQHASGMRNVTQLLERCRQVYEIAWSDMSVTSYLSHNYGLRIQQLAEKVYQASGYLLQLKPTVGQPTMRTTFMRVYQEGLTEADLGFLTNLRSAVATEFKENTTAQTRATAAQGQDYLSNAGQNSRDRFKLTFVMFGDLLQPDDIQGFVDAQGSYRQISGRGEEWRTLHILPAETNVLAIERLLTAGSRDVQQQRRELREEVVTVLEDIDRFRMAMRCLAYSETDYDWGGERGVLLHKYMPPDSGGQSYWRLTVQPEGDLRPDGHIYTAYGTLALPEHYRLTPSANEPDLLQAFIYLVCRGQDYQTGTALDWDKIERTVQAMMQRHREQWDSKPERGWQPTEKTRRNEQLLQEASDRAAQIIRLNALIHLANQKLNEHRWAWAPGTPTPEAIKRDPHKAPNIQRYVDLWTVLRSVAQEEMQNLNGRFMQLGVWKGSTPTENISLSAGVADTDETREDVTDGEDMTADAMPSTPLIQPAPAAQPLASPVGPGLPDGAWICPNCKNQNEANVKFCTNCGERRPAPVVTSAPAEAPAGVAPVESAPPPATIPASFTPPVKAAAQDGVTVAPPLVSGPLPAPAPTGGITPEAYATRRQALEGAYQAGFIAPAQYEAELRKLDAAVAPPAPSGISQEEYTAKRQALEGAYQAGFIPAAQYEAELRKLEAAVAPPAPAGMSQEEYTAKRQALEGAYQAGFIAPAQYEAELRKLDAVFRP